MFKNYLKKQIKPKIFPNFSNFSTLKQKEINFETKEDLDVRYEDEAYFLSKELKHLEEEKIRLYSQL